MKASFIPGDLHLGQSADGLHVVTWQGKEILRTRSARAAASKFKAIRADLESKFPAPEMSMEQKREIAQKAFVDFMVGHNSLGGRKKKTSAGGTRTFGG